MCNLSNNIVNKRKVTLASRLNSLLKEKGIQKKELEGIINRNTITAWCNEKNPIDPQNCHKEKLKQLADFLDVDIEYLLLKQVKKRETKSSDQKFNEAYEFQRIISSIDRMTLCFDVLGVSVKATNIFSSDNEEEWYMKSEVDKVDNKGNFTLNYYEVPVRKINDPSCFKLEISNNKESVIVSFKDFEKYLEIVQAHTKVITDLFIKSCRYSDNKEDKTTQDNTN